MPNTSISFTTHEGVVVGGDKLQAALNKVANDWIDLAARIKVDDAYAKHVSDQTKQENYKRSVERAELIRQGHISSFTAWQAVNEEITGECIAFFPKI